MSRFGHVVLATALFAGLTVLHTWPIAGNPAGTLISNGDVFVGTWAIYDQAAQLVENPWRPFDGVIFHPYGHTIAVVDHQLTNAIVAVPLRWWKPDAPVFSYNGVLLLSFVLGAIFSYLLLVRLTGSRAGALVGACAFSFSNVRLMHVMHPHLLAIHWLPLALLALHAYLERPNLRRWLGVAGACLLVALSSWHVAIIGGIAIGLIGLVQILADGRRVPARLGGLLGAALVSAIVLVPIARVYQDVVSRWATPLTGGQTATAPLASLSTDVRGLAGLPEVSRAPYRLLLEGVGYGEARAFPGVVVLAVSIWMLGIRLRRVSPQPADQRWRLVRLVVGVLVAMAALLVGAAVTGAPSAMTSWLRPLSPLLLAGLALLATGVARARRTWAVDERAALGIAYGLLALVGVLLALGHPMRAWGVEIGTGLLRADLIPALGVIRAPARFLFLMSLGLAVVSALAVATWLDGRSSRARIIMTTALIGLLTVELRVAPLVVDPVPPRAAVHVWLADQPEEGAVIEYPERLNPWQVVGNLPHRRRLVNGLGYLFPPELKEFTRAPEFGDRQLELLWERLHPRFVVIRSDLYAEPQREAALDAVAARPDALKLRTRSGMDYVYELVDRGAGTNLFRRWPAEALRNRSRLVFSAEVLGTEAGRENQVVVTLNGGTPTTIDAASLVDRHQATVEFGPANVVDGENVFALRADYRVLQGEPSHPIGSTGASLRADVAISSAPDLAFVRVNGRALSVDKGYLLVALDPVTGAITRTGAFNVSWYEEASNELAAFARDLPPGTPVVVASEFDVSRRLGAGAVAALRDLGCQEDLRNRPGWAHAAIGVKGAPAGSALEVVAEGTASLTLGRPSERTFQLDGLRLR